MKIENIKDHPNEVVFAVVPFYPGIPATYYTTYKEAKRAYFDKSTYLADKVYDMLLSVVIIDNVGLLGKLVDILISGRVENRTLFIEADGIQY